jgi:hypothetical protein
MTSRPPAAAGGMGSGFLHGDGDAVDAVDRPGLGLVSRNDKVRASGQHLPVLTEDEQGRVVPEAGVELAQGLEIDTLVGLGAGTVAAHGGDRRGGLGKGAQPGDGVGLAGVHRGVKGDGAAPVTVTGAASRSTLSNQHTTDSCR